MLSLPYPLQVLLPVSVSASLFGTVDLESVEAQVDVSRVSLSISPALVQLIQRVVKTFMPQKVGCCMHVDVCVHACCGLYVNVCIHFFAVVCSLCLCRRRRRIFSLLLQTCGR